MMVNTLSIINVIKGITHWTLRTKWFNKSTANVAEQGGDPPNTCYSKFSFRIVLHRKRKPDSGNLATGHRAADLWFSLSPSAPINILLAVSHTELHCLHAHSKHAENTLFFLVGTTRHKKTTFHTFFPVLLHTVTHYWFCMRQKQMKMHCAKCHTATSSGMKLPDRLNGSCSTQYAKRVLHKNQCVTWKQSKHKV